MVIEIVSSFKIRQMAEERENHPWNYRMIVAICMGYKGIFVSKDRNGPTQLKKHLKDV